MKRSSKLKTALVAVGGSLAVTPATALELGNVKVHSSLGQPLRASIAYALSPNETLNDTCVSLAAAPGPAAADIPAVRQASMIVTDGVIAIVGRSVVQEPLLSMRVNIRCPYTPKLTREYMLFVDPADATVSQSAATADSRPSAAPAATPRPAAVRRAPAVRPAASAAPVPMASRHRVEPGETLSGIVQRIEGRTVGLWDAVDTVFAANPNAFIGNDVDRLRAGAWLDIPNLGVAAPAAAAEMTAPVSEAPAAPGSTYEPAETAAAATGAADAGTTARSPLADLQPGDVILDSETPSGVSPAPNDDVFVDIPDTELDAPVATSTSPNAATAVIRTQNADEPSGTNWLLWFVGSGLAIIAALLAFGRRRGGLGSTPVGTAAAPRRPREEEDTQRIEAVDATVDVAIDDDAPTAENVMLDADLDIGTGLREGDDVHVASDFAFASTTGLDLELPEEMSSGDSSQTDIIPPLNIEDDTILESEIFGDDDDYDMSMIVDVTQMPDTAEVTERDLEAVAVTDDDETLITGDYTVSQEADYNIVEQNYEDELTATQALNAEIQKAAQDDEETKDLPLATVHELDATAQMRRSDDADEPADDEDTGVNPTVQMPSADETVEIRGDETAEMPKKKDNSKAG